MGWSLYYIEKRCSLVAFRVRYQRSGKGIDVWWRLGWRRYCLVRFRSRLTLHVKKRWGVVWLLRLFFLLWLTVHVKKVSGRLEGFLFGRLWLRHFNWRRVDIEEVWRSVGSQSFCWFIYKLNSLFLEKLILSLILRHNLLLIFDNDLYYWLYLSIGGIFESFNKIFRLFEIHTWQVSYIFYKVL